jgi:hypothetical protein
MHEHFPKKEKICARSFLLVILCKSYYLEIKQHSSLLTLETFVYSCEMLTLPKCTHKNGVFETSHGPCLSMITLPTKARENCYTDGSFLFLY